MEKRILSICAFAAVFAALVSSAFAADPAKVAKVKSGELKEARVSWWGFNPDDATQFFQAAIDSRVPRLIVDKMPNTWYLTPVKCVSNQEIVFEEGAKVAAKRNAFQSPTDILFTLSHVTNVTFRGNSTEIKMFKDDYAAAPYDFTRVGQRHTFSIHGCEDITLEGLSIVQSGGAGVILSAAGGGKTPCKRIRIANCVVDGSCRRGIWIAGTVGATIENSTIKGTKGNWPQTGVALLTDSAETPLADVNFKNCTISDCEGYGIEFSISGNFDEKTAPLSVSFEGCTIANVESGIHYAGGTDRGMYPRGKFLFDKCTVEHVRRHGLKVYQKPAHGVGIALANCKFIDCCERYKTLPDIDLDAGRNDDPPIDDIVFNNVEIHQGTAKRPWISPFGGNWMAADVKNIAGKVRIFSQSAKKDINLDNFWRKANFPPKSKGATPPRVPFKPGAANIAVTDLAKGGPVALSPLITRGSSRYALCVEKARAVHIRGRYLPVSKQRSSAAITICEYGDDKPVASVPLPDFYEGGDDGEITFDVPKGGFYSMTIRAGHNNFMLTSADVPIALDVGAGAQQCIGSECSLFFTPARGRQFAAFIRGAAAFDIARANGPAALKGDGVRDWSRFLGSAAGINDLWHLKLSKPKQGGFGEYYIDLTGMPGFFFLSDKKYWRVK